MEPFVVIALAPVPAVIVAFEPLTTTLFVLAGCPATSLPTVTVPFLLLIATALAGAPLFVKVVVPSASISNLPVVTVGAAPGVVAGVDVLVVTVNLFVSTATFVAVASSLPLRSTSVSVSLPATSFILVKFSANFTSKPSAVAFRSTLMLLLSVAPRVKVPAPSNVNFSPSLRCTLPVASTASLP